MDKTKEILVIGAGVSGLSTAILLRKAGYDVTIWAKSQSPDITSDIAAAIWYPYLCNPKDKVVAWGRTTLEYLRENVISDQSSGCRSEVMVELFDHAVGDPWWKDAIALSRPDQSELPKGYVDGYKITSVLVDPTIYLGWLTEQYRALGGKLEQRTIASFDEAFAEHDTAINCTGLASRELCNDTEIYPVRGQVVRVKPNGLDYAIVDEEGPNGLAYIVPRFNEIVLGGTAHPNNWSLAVDPADTEDILRKARALSPLFETVEIIDVRVGLRPARSSVRLEVDEFAAGKHLIHNYGHGGAGFTLSWGCAQEAIDLVIASL